MNDNTNKTMLYEIDKPRQIQGQPPRRWFVNDFFDLLVWQKVDGSILGFQLVYDRVADPHAISWNRDAGLLHNRVDDGEGMAGRPKKAPLLIPDGVLDHKSVAAMFRAEAKNIDPNIAAFVYTKIIEAPK